MPSRITASRLGARESRRGRTRSPASRACASCRPRARRAGASPGSRRTSRSRSPRTARRPTASRDSRAASEAPWPPSFQPRNAATRTGRRNSGVNEMFSSDIDGFYVRSRATGRQSLATSPTVQAKTHAATVTCTRTSPHGRPFRYCVSPIAIWTPSSTRRPAQPRTSHGIARALAPRPAREHEEDDPERCGRADVHVDRRLERADAANRFAPRMRARGGRERAGDDERADRREQHCAAEARDRAAAAAAAPRTVRVASSSTSTPSAEHDEREEKVRDDEVRIQVVVDGDRTERRLRERPCEHDPREHLHAGARARA